MLVLRKQSSFLGSMDGSSLSPEAFQNLSQEAIEAKSIATDQGLVPISKVFQVERCETSREDIVLIEGDCKKIEKLGYRMKSGTLCILGDVGERTAMELAGGRILIAGNAGGYLAAGMKDGLIYLSGNCGDNLGSPLPGQKSGLRGGDLFIAGSVGDRACERMRRGTVFVGGDIGSYAASQMIAGSLIIAGELGDHWGAGLRRGSIILFQDYTGEPSASLSEAREFELSFLPLLWKHLERLQIDAMKTWIYTISDVPVGKQDLASLLRSTLPPSPIKIPRTRWVQRQIADQNYQGRGEVLVLRRVSSPEVR